MPKPKLIVVTGPPGAGKSSLAKTLAEKLQLALLSRDEIKRSLLLDLGCSHADAGDNINQQASERFFATVEQALARGNSLVVEAAFQHRLWSTWLPAQARIADSRCRYQHCDWIPRMVISLGWRPSSGLLRKKVKPRRV